MKRVRESEFRYLLRGVVGVVGTVAAAAFLWSTAWSPGALAGPGRLLLQGKAEAAKDAYVSLAAGIGSDETRAEAQWRGALLSATDLDQPLVAIEMLQELIRQHPGSARAIEANAEMARLYRDRLDQPGKAAPLYQKAAEIAPEDTRAGTWWLEAGRTYDHAGENDLAVAALEQAARYEDTAAAAHLALGPIVLESDSTKSVAHYEQAIALAPDETLRRVARLGLAAALEHDKKYDEALAQLALIEPDQAVRHRQERLASLMKVDSPAAAIP
jgi:tetratricopeptide (TPR) repeat protein